MNRTLLHTPEGVKDCYGKEYAIRRLVEEKIHASLLSYGYEDILTPSFEFFDVFSREVGTIPSNELYKFFDKENRTLVLRPDFTPSIARCAAKYFMEEDVPRRFCYHGNVFTNTSALQGKLCEETQMGAELIEDPSVQADAEMIALVVDALRSAGLSEFQISIGQVDFFKGLCEEAGLSTETELALREYISGKNIFAAQELLEQAKTPSEYAEKLLQIGNSFEDHGNFTALRSNVKNERSLRALDRLEDLHRLLEMYGVSEFVSFDLGMLSKYNYYTGIIFKAFTYGVGRPVATGGRYDRLLSHFGKEAAAIGFVVQIDDLIEALSRQKNLPEYEDQRVIVFYDSHDAGQFRKALEEARELRKEGKMVVLTPASAQP
jgi:ATP phosphoribosyltransferase regulatory subunit